MMKIESFGITDIGQRRQRNEDRFIVDDRLGLYLVCDGMGGHAGGDIAAETASNAVADFFRDRQSLIMRLQNQRDGHVLAGELAEEAVHTAHRRVREAARKTLGLRDMGTTLTMLLVAGRWAVSAHVGDSRLYRIRCG
ncbi:MAG: protein phosphatase 2C domain-containing protein, partial [Planctomycetes bacterium]|nr:protein phosphatase 2C domain-containing protein [Planctomycetota bacterium]